MLFVIVICCCGSFILGFADAMEWKGALELDLDLELDLAKEGKGVSRRRKKEQRAISFLCVKLAVLSVMLTDFVGI
jgi:hypothetical protein